MGHIFFCSGTCFGEFRKGWDFTKPVFPAGPVVSGFCSLLLRKATKKLILLVSCTKSNFFFLHLLLALRKCVIYFIHGRVFRRIFLCLSEFYSDKEESNSLIKSPEWGLTDDSLLVHKFLVWPSANLSTLCCSSHCHWCDCAVLWSWAQ